MRTEILSMGRSKSHLASKTSKPLFIIVAESIVTRCPMRHVGWLRAMAGVTVSRIAAKRPAGRSENHLPDFLPLAGPQALVDGVVFAVYRKYFDLVAFRRG